MSRRGKPPPSPRHENLSANLTDRARRLRAIAERDANEAAGGRGAAGPTQASDESLPAPDGQNRCGQQTWRRAPMNKPSRQNMTGKLFQI